MHSNPYWPQHAALIIDTPKRVQHPQLGWGTATHIFANDEYHIKFDGFEYNQPDERARHHAIMKSRLIVS